MPLWFFPLLALLSLFVLRTWVFEIFVVESTSMAPSLLSGDRLLVDRLAYRSSRPVPGDVVVFSATLPGETRSYYVKRVIGLEGDEVQERDGRLWVNGELWQVEVLEEVELDASGALLRPGLAPATYLLATEHSSHGSWQVLFNRAEESRKRALRRKNSGTQSGAVRIGKERSAGLPGEKERQPGARLRDGELPPSESSSELNSETRSESSRQALPKTKEKEVEGELEVGDGELFPSWKVRPGHVLLVGDNRSESLDTRALAGHGQIPLDALSGKVRRVLWSAERKARQEPSFWRELDSPAESR